MMNKRKEADRNKKGARKEGKEVGLKKRVTCKERREGWMEKEERN